MSNNAAFDASIPVLTEVFQDQPVKHEALETSVAEAAPAADAARAAEDWTGPEWDLLERRLCERILHQLQGRIDGVLEERLRDSMEQALQHAMAGLTDDIRRSLQDTIEKIVVAAVAQELTLLQPPRE